MPGIESNVGEIFIDHRAYRMSGVDSATLSDPDRVSFEIKSAAVEVGLTIAKPLAEMVKKFNPPGVTYGVVLEESSIEAHTWPSNGFMYVDVQSCSEDVDLSKFGGILVARFNPRRIIEGIMNFNSTVVEVPSIR